MRKGRLNTVELFAGCGGFVEGFNKAEIYHTLACVEWNEKPCEVLKKRLSEKYNESENKVLRFDIQRTAELINGWENDENYGSNEGLDRLVGGEKVDLIVGGPPCQAYSMAGRVQDKDGMKNDYRNYLFESYIEVVKHYKPMMIVFENVEGMLSACPGGIAIVDRIKEAFDECGYEIINDIRKYALLDLAQFGVPQQRKRVILVGLNRQNFNGDNQKKLEHFYLNILAKYKVDKIQTVKDAISDLTPLYPLEQEVRCGNRKHSHNFANCSIQGHISRYHSERDRGIFSELAKDITDNRNRYITTEALKQLYTERTGKTSNIHKYNVLRWDKPSNTIPAHLKKDGLRHIHPDYKQARSITVREAARLQTFDDDFKFTGIMTADFEMIGNAVPPLFAKKLANAIEEFLREQGLLF